MEGKGEAEFVNAEPKSLEYGAERFNIETYLADYYELGLTKESFPRTMLLRIKTQASGEEFENILFEKLEECRSRADNDEIILTIYQNAARQINLIVFNIDEE